MIEGFGNFLAVSPRRMRRTVFRPSRSFEAIWRIVRHSTSHSRRTSIRSVSSIIPKINPSSTYVHHVLYHPPSKAARYDKYHSVQRLFRWYLVLYHRPGSAAPPRPPLLDVGIPAAEVAGITLRPAAPGAFGPCGRVPAGRPSVCDRLGDQADSTVRRSNIS